MTVIAFLNEHSHQTPDGVSDADAKISVEHFIDVAIQLRKTFPRLALVAAFPLLQVPLGATYSLSHWIAGASRERRSFLLSLANHAPFSKAADLLPNVDVIGYVYFDGAPFDGLELEAIGLADLYESFAISFDLDERWRIPLVPIRSDQINSAGAITRRSAKVLHVCLIEHCETHRESLIGLARSAKEPTQIWKYRADLFPYLRFLPKVEEDLTDIHALALPHVLKWLYQMNDFVYAWRDSGKAIPQYPPHTTDEGETRSRLCWFRDCEGEQCFSWHGRFTPGAGRIHFRLSAPEQKVVIGYIGQKLERRLVR